MPSDRPTPAAASPATGDTATGHGGTGVDVTGYALVTAGYWVFTITDGALRMLVLLHFHRLGFSPIAIAFLFLAYELMGVFTNIFGGWAGARGGVQRTLVAGLVLQAFVLGALTLQQPGWARWWSVAYVMGLQAFSGVAKDLTKMSAKAAVKTFAAEGSLFRLVAMLTGSKNALKGVGFFIGGALLSWIGYNRSLAAMSIAVALAAIAIFVLIRQPIGRTKRKPPLSSLLSKSAAINWLSAARLFLFGARDVWFVVAAPVFLSDRLGWGNQAVGTFFAVWVIGYGVVQSAAPSLARSGTAGRGASVASAVRAEQFWVVALLTVTVGLAALVNGLNGDGLGIGDDRTMGMVVVVGLAVFGAVFAINSSLHSYLIIAFADDDATSLDVGFYYSANAMGRLIGTLLSGVCAMVGGLGLSLWISAALVAVAALLTAGLGRDGRRGSLPE